MTQLSEHDAVDALIRDLHEQIDQMKARGIKNATGNPYNPSYYKRGLQEAIDRGRLEVVEYVRRFLGKPPSDGYKKLEEADSLDLACETLVADETKPYAFLFTAEDRIAANARLAPHLRAIEDRAAQRQARIDVQRTEIKKTGLRLTELDASRRARGTLG